MYGESAHKLTQHAKRAIALPTVPPYQSDLVRSTIREVRALNTSIEADLASIQGGLASPDPEDQGKLLKVFVEHAYMRRNKRCLVAYHRQRVDKVAGLVWAGVDLEEGMMANPNPNEEGLEKETSGRGNGLSPEEEEYARGYAELLAGYKGQWTDIDLTGSLEPPRDLFIDVRVLKDAGEIQSEYGSINLTKNSQFYVRQGDVERLIQQGYLQKLN